MATTALEQATDQRQLLSTQLEEVATAGQAAWFGSERHADLSRRAVSLRHQIRELDRLIASLQEAAKTDADRQAEAEASAKAAKAAATAQAAEDKAKALEVVAAINQASDTLAKALALAGEVMPGIKESLATHAGYNLTGHWESIRPTSWSSGRIGALPYVIANDTGARLASRGEAGGGKNIG